MRCLEAAQMSTKLQGSVAPPDVIVARAKEFEAYVVGDEPKPTATRTKKAAAE